jgi:hypothetical protein
MQIQKFIGTLNDSPKIIDVNSKIYFLGDRMVYRIYR